MRRATRFAVALGLALFGAVAPTSAGADTRHDYIVVFHDSVADPASLAGTEATEHGGTVHGVYSYALKGFAAELPDAAVAKLRKDSRVAAVVPDAPIHLVGGESRWGAWPAFDNPTIQAQDIPTGIRRVGADDNPNLDIDGQDDARFDADIAIIDTGIDFDHPDLNVVARTDCTSGTCRDNAGDDGNGHGSHVAGTAAAIDNGIGVVGMAPGARLHAVKVLADNGSGQFSWAIAGIDWVAARSDTIESVNMSFGGTGAGSALDTAINNAVGRGIVFAAAAGNNGQDVGNFQPANNPNVITVSALADFNGAPGGGAGTTCRSDQDDTLASFSNFGPQIEVTAPGVCINSTFRDGGYNAGLSGTSMASPHVAGAAAIVASTQKPTNRDESLAVRQHIIDNGNAGWTDDSGDGIKEPLLDVHDAEQFPPNTGGNRRPLARFTFSCNESTRACSFDGSGSSDPDGSITAYAWDFGDGGTGTGVRATHTYGANGLFSVRLTVTDDQGATGATSASIRVGPNQSPTASFTPTCRTGNFPACSFDGRASSDPDGSIATYSWNFGDGKTATDATAFHNYGKSGTFTVTLTVTDNEGATASASRQVTVTCGFPFCR